MIAFFYSKVWILVCVKTPATKRETKTESWNLLIYILSFIEPPSTSSSKTFQVPSSHGNLLLAWYIKRIIYTSEVAEGLKFIKSYSIVINL